MSDFSPSGAGRPVRPASRAFPARAAHLRRDPPDIDAPACPAAHSIGSHRLSCPLLQTEPIGLSEQAAAALAAKRAAQQQQQHPPPLLHSSPPLPSSLNSSVDDISGSMMVSDDSLSLELSGVAGGSQSHAAPLHDPLPAAADVIMDDSTNKVRLQPFCSNSIDPSRAA